MKHYDIEGQDNLKVPIFTTRPTWSSSYIGKVIYESSTGKLLYGGSSSWTEAGGGGGGGGNVQSILYNSDMSVWQRNSYFDEYSSPYKTTDGQCTADRWIVLSNGNYQCSIAMGVIRPPDFDAKETYLVLENAYSVAKRQVGILQILPTVDVSSLVGKTLSFRLKVRGAEGNTINNIRAAILYHTDFYDEINADIVQTWNGSGVNPTFRSGWTLLNTPQNLAVPSTAEWTWAEYKVEGINLPSEQVGKIAVFVWVDDDPTPSTYVIHLTDIDLIVGSTFTEPVRRSHIEELNRCMYFYENCYPAGNYPGDNIIISCPITTRNGKYTHMLGPSRYWYNIVGFSFRVQKYRLPTVRVWHPESGVENRVRYLYQSGGADVNILSPTPGCPTTQGVPYLVYESTTVPGATPFSDPMPATSEVLYAWDADAEFRVI